MRARSLPEQTDLNPHHQLQGKTQLSKAMECTCRETQEEQDLRNADLQNRQLDEDNFHEIVNDDEQMYDDIEAVPIDDDNMVNQILTILKNHVSEVWSPP